MTLTIPKLSLVLLIGPSGSGKSTFARRHFLPTEVISSDYCRGIISDDENNQAITGEAFDLLHTIAAKRLALGKLTVIDATSVQPEARAPLVSLAKRYHAIAVAIVLNLPEHVCHERNATRKDRQFGPHVVRNQRAQLRRSIKGLKREGFKHVYILDTLSDVESTVIERVPLWNDKTHDHGPFDIIGDVHGCADELEQLLEKLGYSLGEPGASATGVRTYFHSDRRKAVFVGDLVDRGPRVVDTLNIVQAMVEHGSAYCVPGNHDDKLLRKLRGSDVKISHGLAQTLAEIDAIPEPERVKYQHELERFLDGLVSHYVFDDGKLCVAHAGLKAELIGRASGRVRSFALYGDTTGETDEFGLPVRLNWAADYRGSAMVVYGHTPVPEPAWLNNTVNIDTGCVFGGKLSALRYPEREIVSVSAAKVYCEPSRPFLPVNTGLSVQQIHDDLLDAQDVLGKRIITTRLRNHVTIRENHATAALEVMSRFAANPKWLIYLPPTMSPSETSHAPGYLEHPTEALTYYRQQDVTHVVCEEKHMGSRAVVVICRDEKTVRERFGIVETELGIVYTRTGRRFFNDLQLETAFLDRLHTAITKAKLWEALKSNWFCFDCELMPWSAKAQELLKNQYAAVGAAGRASLSRSVELLKQTSSRLTDDDLQKVNVLLNHFEDRNRHVNQFVDAYRQYCWPVNSINDLKLAPFHLLASEGHVHTDKDHRWHMETLATVCREDPELLRETPYKIVDLHSQPEVDLVTQWWTELTNRGGEGMVVKPLEFITRGERGVIQPAIKCRGPEYLRIIYGPDYSTESNLTRLRKRGLNHKRSLALGEFALGIEALERFVRREPLRKVHECVFGVLALESEPVDPRL